MGERLIAMSGQFEQRRLARAAYQLDVLDGFVGEEQAARASRRCSNWPDMAIRRSAAAAMSSRATLRPQA